MDLRNYKISFDIKRRKHRKRLGELATEVDAESSDDSESPEKGDGERFTIEETNIYESASLKLIQLKRVFKDTWDHDFLPKKSVRIEAGYFRAAFTHIAGRYPGIVDEGDALVISAPYAALFHYMKAISEYITKTDSDKPQNFEDDIKAVNSYLNVEVGTLYTRITTSLSHGLIVFDDTWAVFRPGDILVSRDMFGEPRMLFCSGIQPAMSTRSIREGKIVAWIIDAWYVSFNEPTQTFSRIETRERIARFSGSQQISSWYTKPAKNDFMIEGEDQDQLKTQLAARGRKWKTYFGAKPAYQLYNGPAILSPSVGDIQKRDKRMNLVDNVVIDPFVSETIVERIGPYASRSSRSLSRDRTDEETPDPLPMTKNYARYDNHAPDEDFDELQACLCTTVLRAYAMQMRIRLLISMVHLQPVTWKKGLFDSLILADDVKTYVQNLVQRHFCRKFDSEELSGKGQGLIILLHGTPGTGKTFTAECVAQYTESPLLTISLGQISAKDNVSMLLKLYFDRAANWNAVLLLDEADVLLEARASEDFVRNGLVSEFLRTLEYFTGIVIMTTNRVKYIDEAFKSRIDVAIEYKEFATPIRRQIWENSINNLDQRPAVKRGVLEKLDEMQDWPLNGRQITNIMRLAETLSFDSLVTSGDQLYDTIKRVAEETIGFQEIFQKDRHPALAIQPNQNPRWSERRRF